MAWTLTDDIADYQAAARGLLSADPVRNTVLLSVLASLASLGPTAFGPEPPLLGWWAPGNGADPDVTAASRTVRAAVLQTPPHALLITGLPEGSAAQLAQALANRGISLPGVNGAEADVTAFAQAWHHLAGVPGRVSQRQRLYRLGELERPEPPPGGAARVATTADGAVARAFYSAFAAEVGQDDAPRHLIADRVHSGQLMLWEVNGEPVSIAGVGPVLGGVARIGPVFTPRQWRGRGYGGAVTAAVSELAARRGASSVVLFTDLANPESNSLYLKLGYEPVEDRVLLLFER
jgi:predicted GNAT family acetyltransferase